MGKSLKRKPGSGKSFPGKYFFDPAAASRAVEFFPLFLKHRKGKWAGTPLRLESWQTEIISALFGEKQRCGPKCKKAQCAGLHPRRYRTLYLEVPRKNGKSTLAAGIALLLLYADNEAGAEVYSAAADRQQAHVVFDLAHGMAAGDEDLAKVSEFYRRSIVVPSTASSYRVLSADVATKHGLNVSGVVVDELHAQPTRDLVDVLTTGTGSRDQPLTILITTAGEDVGSVCWEYHEYAQAVIAGEIRDDSFLPVLFSADESDDWRVLDTWKKANPNLGVSVNLEYLERECKRAEQVPAFQPTFKRLHLNLWATSATAWLPLEWWDACPRTPAILEGRRCFGGLDLAATMDTTAYVLIFPPDHEGGEWHQLAWVWAPETALETQSKANRARYRQFSDAGHITLTEGNIIDYQIIRRKILETAKLFALESIGYDPWNATQLSTQLVGDGVKMIQVRQGYRTLSEPMKTLSGLIRDGKWNHGGNDLLRWQLSNVSVRTDENQNISPTKKTSRGQIDGIVATLGALAVTLETPVKGTSKYATGEKKVIFV